ncbi:type II toxin-antitoxin system VapC family toxin [Moraxella sp. K127]|uniref:type II toxin-antitoxin system VapC family toxin n=2 Tax=Moraxella TaxID=475 RepID=UPI0018828C55|nr:type II toxin-antitoxin system VapC family toxin [Moraxella sp. K127]MBE9591272.1 type II toxin-antitoxin system VapC family toxin [Moraxella sp. K127]
MKYMLDTNTLIYFIKNKPPAVREKINRMLGKHELCMSFITYGELLKGAYGSQDPKKAKQDFENLAKLIPVLSSHPKMTDHYGKWANALKTKGMPIGNNDLWIASHALAVGAVVVTRNSREFERITDLAVEDWTV